MSQPLAAHDFTSGGLAAALEFLKRTRAELRTLYLARVWPDRLHVVDVNHDYFEIRGVGYRHAEIIPLLQSVNTAFNPDTVHEPVDLEYKEFKTGRRYPWAYDRIL